MELRCVHVWKGQRLLATVYRDILVYNNNYKFRGGAFFYPESGLFLKTEDRGH